MEGQVLEILMNKYDKATLTKKEVAEELGLSLRTIDSMIKDGCILPRPLKLGKSKKSAIRFNIIDIAEYITDAIGYTVLAEGRYTEETK